MKEIIKILMNRDGISYEEAKEMVEDCREEMSNLIEMGCFEDAYYCIEDCLGLEPDYIMDLI